VLVWVFASVNDIQFNNKLDNNRTMALEIGEKCVSGKPKLSGSKMYTQVLIWKVDVNAKGML